jgi:hypothetical protein
MKRRVEKGCVSAFTDRLRTIKLDKEKEGNGRTETEITNELASQSYRRREAEIQNNLTKRCHPERKRKRK